MVTMRQVAQRAGVSTATVSRVINGRPGRPELRQRVLAAVDELGYRPNGVARSLRRADTRTLGLVISDLLNPFFTELARAVEDEARSFGLSLIVGNADEQPDRLDHYVRTLLERQVDGLLVVPTTQDSPLLHEALDRGDPVVFVDRDLPGVDAPVIRSENRPAVRALVDHLVELGHRRPAIIAGPQALVTGRERLEEFVARLTHHGIALPPELVRIGDFQLASGVAATAALLDLPDPPTVIYATDNLMGLGALQELRRRHVRIPDDVGLVVHDDLPWLALLDPPVTAIAQPTLQLGRLAVQTLRARMAGEPAESRLLPSQLVVRASVARVS